MASSSGSPCAACKFLRRKCTAECVFAPYFPPDQPHKFANVHKIFGASNITKLLNELPAHKREDAVNSLAYEADWRMRDPVYGCVGTISILQAKLQRLVCDLHSAHAELARYTGMVPNGQAPLMQPSTPTQQQMNLVDLGMGNLGLHNQQDPTYSQALLEQQQLPHYAREQWAEIVRLGNGSYEAGLAALGVNPNIVASGGGGGAPSPMSTSGLYNSYQRTGTSDGASRSSGGSLGHLSPQ